MLSVIRKGSKPQRLCINPDCASKKDEDTKSKVINTKHRDISDK